MGSIVVSKPLTSNSPLGAFFYSTFYVTLLRHSLEDSLVDCMGAVCLVKRYHDMCTHLIILKKLESVNDSQRATAKHTQLITGPVRDSPPYLLSLEPDFGLMVKLNN